MNAPHRGATAPRSDAQHQEVPVDPRKPAVLSEPLRLSGWCPTAIDQAAIASGRRRAAPRDYQAARETR